MTERDKMIAKVQKLLALSQSSNEHEAAAAMERAEAMLREYDLSMSEVEANEQLDQGVVEEKYRVPNLKMKYVWVAVLARAAARLFDGELLMYRSLHGTEVAFVGNPGDIPAMKAMFEHLWESWRSFVEVDLREEKKAALEVYGHRYTPGETMKFKQGHGGAFANRIYRRVDEIVQARKSQAAEHSTSHALVVQKDQMVRDYVSSNSVKSKSRSSAGSSAGRSAGSRAGDSVSLGGVVTGSKTALIGGR